MKYMSKHLNYITFGVLLVFSLTSCSEESNFEVTHKVTHQTNPSVTISQLEQPSKHKSEQSKLDREKIRSSAMTSLKSAAASTTSSSDDGHWLVFGKNQTKDALAKVSTNTNLSTLNLNALYPNGLGGLNNVGALTEKVFAMHASEMTFYHVFNIYSGKNRATTSLKKVKPLFIERGCQNKDCTLIGYKGQSDTDGNKDKLCVRIENGVSLLNTHCNNTPNPNIDIKNAIWAGQNHWFLFQEDTEHWTYVKVNDSATLSIENPPNPKSYGTKIAAAITVGDDVIYTVSSLTNSSLDLKRYNLKDDTSQIFSGKIQLNASEKIVSITSKIPGVFYTNQGRFIKVTDIGSPTVSYHQITNNNEEILYVSRFVDTGTGQKVALVIARDTTNKIKLYQINDQFNKIKNVTPAWSEIPDLSVLGAFYVKEGTDGFWQIYFEDGRLYRLKTDLSSIHPDKSEFFDGKEVQVALKGSKGLLLAGGEASDGKFQFVPNTVTTTTTIPNVEQVTGIGTIKEGVWSGQQFILGTDQGFILTISPDGQKNGDPYKLKNNFGIKGFAQLGDSILVALNPLSSCTADCTPHISWIRSSDGSTLRQFKKIDGMAEIVGVTSSALANITTRYWLVAGNNSNKKPVAGLIDSNHDLVGSLRTFNSQQAPVLSVGHVGNHFFYGLQNGKIFWHEDASLNGQINSRDIFPQVLTVTNPVKKMIGNGKSLLMVGENVVVNYNTVNGPGIYQLPFEGKTITTAVWSQSYGHLGNTCVKHCISGVCVDGMCCNQTCDEGCKSCKHSKTGGEDGLCLPIPAGELPKTTNDCKDTDASTCGTIHQCDGHGACKNHPANTVCKTQRCEQNTHYAPASCAGDGTACPEQVATQCGDYRCKPEGCPTTCNTNEDCVEGKSCENGACIQKTTQSSDGGSGQSTTTEEEKSGCATTGATTPPLLLLLLGFFALKRREVA